MRRGARGRGVRRARGSARRDTWHQHRPAELRVERRRCHRRRLVLSHFVRLEPHNLLLVCSHDDLLRHLADNSLSQRPLRVAATHTREPPHHLPHDACTDRRRLPRKDQGDQAREPERRLQRHSSGRSRRAQSEG